MKSLKQTLSELYNVTIDRNVYKKFKKHVTLWELRPGYPEVLNSALLGVELIYFLPKDGNFLFELFDIDQAQFKRDVHNVESINTDFIVSSDIYNIFTVWVAHKVRTSSLPKSIKLDFQYLLFKMLNYKFFTSVVNYNFRYKADLSIMQYTIDNVSGKFDIKHDETPTWKLVLEARANDIISRSSIHDRTLDTFSADDKVLYIITDTQTRVRTRINAVRDMFHKNKEEGNVIKGQSLIEADIEGEKVIKNIVSSFDSMVNNISNAALNTNKFIDHDSIQLAVKLTKNIRVDDFRTLLVKFSNMALEQYKSNQSEDIGKPNNPKVAVGYRKIIEYVIQKTYRAVVLDKSVDISSKLPILVKVRNIYKSSRITDEGILIAKESVKEFVYEHSKSRRESTNVSLTIGLLTYLILLSFKHM